MILFSGIIIAVVLILHFTPPKRKRAVFLPTLTLAAIGAAYSIFEFAQAFDSIPGRWAFVGLTILTLLVNLVFVYRSTNICESCGHFSYGSRKQPPVSNCPKCGTSYDADVAIVDNQRTEPRELPPLPEMPDSFTAETSGSICTIQHTRTGMKTLNVFLSLFLVIWTVACVMTLREYLGEGKVKDESEMPLWVLLFFVASWFMAAFFLLYSLFARKTFILKDETLEVETDLLGLRRRLTLSRDTIARIRQLKDGGEEGDSFPSWGLEIESSQPNTSFLRQLASLNNSGRFNRYRVLAKLPHEQSAWLGNTLARWSNAELTLCPNSSDSKPNS